MWQCLTGFKALLEKQPVIDKALYQQLEHARVGKGSFVSACPVLPQAIRAQDYQSINLSIIKPQVALAESQLTEQSSL